MTSIILLVFTKVMCFILNNEPNQRQWNKFAKLSLAVPCLKPSLNPFLVGTSNETQSLEETEPSCLIDQLPTSQLRSNQKL